MTGCVLGSIVKSFELTNIPVRAGKFIARKNWIVCGSDVCNHSRIGWMAGVIVLTSWGQDFQLRILNYNTSEKIASFEAVGFRSLALESEGLIDRCCSIQIISAR